MIDEALDMACSCIADMCGTCPLDAKGDECSDWQDDCEERCSSSIGMGACWRRYFEQAAGRA